MSSRRDAISFSRRRVGILSAIVLSALAVPLFAQTWKMQPLEMSTRWTSSVTPNTVWPEYPRPQLVRRDWQNLNGLWNYALTDSRAAVPATYQGAILVPFPIESPLSGVERPLQPNQLLWYRRAFSLPDLHGGKRTLLHFGAVDYQATVYVNGAYIGVHTGGYQSFTFDVTETVHSGENELVVRVYDPSDQGPNPHGKQSLYPQGIFYTASSGIWQTVWLESVPRTYVQSLSTTPDVDHSQLRLNVELGGDTQTHYRVQAIIREGRKIVSQAEIDGASSLSIPHPRLWSPDDPFLYDLQVRMLKGAEVVDEVTSYFGMRKIDVRKDSAGVDRVFINNRYTYSLGLLDQGFWPDGLYTAPSDAALIFDIQAAKAMGFNTIRKHVKIEPDRWYYHCDKLGLLVWQDMVPPASDALQARVEFESETRLNLAQLGNHPSIVAWVLFNEGWGAYDQSRLARWMKDLDATRLLDAHSGPPVPYWDLNASQLPAESPLRDAVAAWIGSDFIDVHSYPEPESPFTQLPGVKVLGEYGGLGVTIGDHVWNDLPGWGYVQLTPNVLAEEYGRMVDKLRSLERLGLSGSIYTQPYDVEREQNGLLTYDREVSKMPIAEIAKINSRIVPRAKNYVEAIRGFSIENADSTRLARRYAALLSQYRPGQNDLPYLRRLTSFAIGRNDQATATRASNELIERSPKPYLAPIWAFVAATTRTTHDTGFELLRSQASEADASLGENAAEKTVRSVIEHEMVDPHISTHGSAPDWALLEHDIATRYGPLGSEAVYGAAMKYYFDRRDWQPFGRYYSLYFDTASARSDYPIDEMTQAMFEHVVDRGSLQVAVNAGRYCVEIRKDSDFGLLDLYANLLYKVGRNSEAIAWEEHAVRVSGGQDKEISNRLAKMKSGQPTWPTS